MTERPGVSPTVQSVAHTPRPFGENADRAPCHLFGVPTYTEHGEAIRQAVNHWIRTSGAFDRVVDFDAATRDPADPRRLRPGFDQGNHIHPNDAGNRAMAEAIDLPSFTR